MPKFAEANYVPFERALRAESNVTKIKDIPQLWAELQAPENRKTVFLKIHNFVKNAYWLLKICMSCYLSLAYINAKFEKNRVGGLKDIRMRESSPHRHSNSATNWHSNGYYFWH